ncbi:hypothetical protein Tco_0847864 [Tanacetum coccineum]
MTMPITRSGASRTREGINEQVDRQMAGALGACTTARNLEPLMRDGGGQEELNGNGENRNGGDENGENRNGGNGNGNGNGGKDIKVKKSKNEQKPTRNEETSDQERDLKPISKAGSKPWSRKDKKTKKRTKG